MQLAVIEFSRNVLGWKGNNFSHCLVSYAHNYQYLHFKKILVVFNVHKSSAHDLLLLMLSIIMHTH